MSVADVYDALISPRVYKPAMSHAVAQELIVQGRGTYFAPEVVDAFVELSPEFQKIAHQFADAHSELAHRANHALNAMGPMAAVA
jgi:putative two-component system response regulator